MIPALRTPGSSSSRRSSSLEPDPPVLGSGVGLRRQRDLEGEHVVGVEAGLHLLQGEEAPDQQAGAHQEHDGERHLGQDEQLPHPPAVAGAAASAALQALVGIGARGARRRQQAEDHRGHAAGQGGEEEHGAVQLHVAQAREVGRVQGPERLQRQHRESQPQPATRQRQQQALGEYLAQ